MVYPKVQSLVQYYSNDLPEQLKINCKLYADDNKLIAPIQTQQEIEIMQADITKLDRWSQDWLIKFNFDKCKVMHIGKNNPQFDYKMTNSGVL